MGMFDIQPDTTDQPFGSNDPDDLGEGFDVPPIPVGVMAGHITEVKTLKTGQLVMIQCDDPNYAQADETAMFVGSGDTFLLGLLAGVLGVTVTQQGTKIHLRDSDGNKDAKALVGKAGLFVFAPYVKDGIEQASVSTCKFGAPQAGKSSLWDAYWEQSGFDEKHIAALKKSRGGAVPSEHHHLFTE